ncbi:MAG TPA: hypothetical protein VGO17_12955 [Aurantimonas sp.]|jgi:putative hemolysin|nr:hypothetical protein [Aurantimonas sp.]
MRSYPELTYARPGDRLLKRLAIGCIEDVSGRRRLARLYGIWRSRIAAGYPLAFEAMLELMRIRLDCRRALTVGLRGRVFGLASTDTADMAELDAA